MNTEKKIKILGDAAKMDSCSCSFSNREIPKDRVGDSSNCIIYHSFTEDGREISLYKTLLTNVCSFDCKYCPHAAGNKKEAAIFKPEELAKVFMNLFLRNYVEGLFLSSGIMKNPDFTAEMMLETVNLLRNKHKFQGYIHLKILPGTSYELVKQASEVADRVSVNLEAPNASRMKEISSVKDFKIDLLRRQAWIKRMKVASGQTTQYVVGASDESDLEILKMVDWGYKNLDLIKSHFSVF